MICHSQQPRRHVRENAWNDVLLPQNPARMPRAVAGAAAERGFVLVATLLMLVLLVVIGVGMLGLSAIALRQSTHELAVAEARANARLALMLALGDLQRLAGPDARFTATADIAGTADGSVWQVAAAHGGRAMRG